MSQEKFKALREGHSSDFWGKHAPICPHCGDTFDINKNEAWDLYEDNDDHHKVECSSCYLDFQVETIITYRFSTDDQEEYDA